MEIHRNSSQQCRRSRKVSPHATVRCIPTTFSCPEIHIDKVQVNHPRVHVFRGDVSKRFLKSATIRFRARYVRRRRHFQPNNDSIPNSWLPSARTPVRNPFPVCPLFIIFHALPSSLSRRICKGRSDEFRAPAGGGQEENTCEPGSWPKSVGRYFKRIPYLICGPEPWAYNTKHWRSRCQSLSRRIYGVRVSRGEFGHC